MKKDPTIKQRKMQEISAKINNTAKEKLSHLPKVCSKFFYRSCVFRRASVCTSDPRNVLRVTAVLSSRSRKPELELHSSDCICLEVICLRLKPACTYPGWQLLLLLQTYLPWRLQKPKGQQIFT